MIIPWKRVRESKESAENRSPVVKVGPIIEFESAILLPSIRGLNIRIQSNSWVTLSGSDELGIALFCDLCFNFVKPEEGQVNTELSSKDVSILGRSATTYGATIWEHITCGTTAIAKEDILRLPRSVLRDSVFLPNAKQEAYLKMLHSPISDFEFSERSWLEISELNNLLQKRSAVVVDTTSGFYEAAVSYGYTHSKEFIDQEILYLWIIQEDTKPSKKNKPWLLESKINRIQKLSFVSESHPKYIN